MQFLGWVAVIRLRGRGGAESPLLPEAEIARSWARGRLGVRRWFRGGWSYELATTASTPGP